VPVPRARGERVLSDHEDRSNRTAASIDPVCDLWDRMKKTESRSRLKFSLQPGFVDWVNRDPIDSLHGENSEQRPSASQKATVPREVDQSRSATAINAANSPTPAIVKPEH